ncbi:hypothetical protein OH77DRAFT_1173305 [Trametes cingulata]|nr:hypothetical protein OH77DRAFT_1173305 [Trametes cingulata]
MEEWSRGRRSSGMRRTRLKLKHPRAARSGRHATITCTRTAEPVSLGAYVVVPPSALILFILVPHTQFRQLTPSRSRLSVHIATP